MNTQPVLHELTTNIIEISFSEFLTNQSITKNFPIEGELIKITLPKDFLLSNAYSFQYMNKIHFFIIKIKEEENVKIKFDGQKVIVCLNSIEDDKNPLDWLNEMNKKCVRRNVEFSIENFIQKQKEKETKEIQEVEKQMILNEKGNEKLNNFENMLNEKEAVLGELENKLI